MIPETLVLKAYEDIAVLTGRMLIAARGAQWDELVTLERDCNALFTRLIQLDEGSPPRGAEFQRRKAEIVRQLLSDDAEIRVLVEPWLAELQALLGLTARRQQIVTAYQPAGAAGPR